MQCVDLHKCSSPDNGSNRGQGHPCSETSDVLDKTLNKSNKRRFKKIIRVLELVDKKVDELSDLMRDVKDRISAHSAFDLEFARIQSPADDNGGITNWRRHRRQEQRHRIDVIIASSANCAIRCVGLMSACWQIELGLQAHHYIHCCIIIIVLRALQSSKNE